MARGTELWVRRGAMLREITNAAPLDARLERVFREVVGQLDQGVKFVVRDRHCPSFIPINVAYTWVLNVARFGPDMVGVDGCLLGVSSLSRYASRACAQAF